MMYYIRISDCQNCDVVKNCQAKKRKGKKWRVVYRSLQQDFFENQLRRMQLPEFQSALKERMWKIEGINSESKNQHGLRKARYRGLKKMQIQADMVASVLNIKRLLACRDFIYCIMTIFIIIYSWLEQNKEKYIILVTKNSATAYIG